MFDFSRECTIVRRTEGTITDDYGNPISGTVHVDGVCEIQQIRRDEPGAAGETSVTEWNLYMPIGGTLDTSDTVIVGGVEYEVVGDPWYADTGSTDVHHIEATLVRAPG